MSHQVVVDFEGIAIQIQSQCEVASHSLCKIDKVLNRIHETASKLENSKVKEYENYLLESKDKIQKSINSFVESLNEYKELKTKTFDDDFNYGNDSNKSLRKRYMELNNVLRSKGEELVNMVNDLTGSKLAVIDEMINEGLLNVGQMSVQKMLDKMNGVLEVDKELLEKINAIEGVPLRELVYRELLKPENKGMTVNELYFKAQKEYDLLLGKSVTKAIEECKHDLEASGVSSDILDNVTTVTKATEITNEVLTSEKIRKETLRIIIKAIKDRGFIVDTKKNLKIDRDKNIVKLVALKASGQTAEFEIQLNGKFMYRFEGYEGQACNKDIDPFVEDLKNIYDLNILHEEVIWSNPDKISTQKYQHMKSNKGTN